MNALVATLGELLEARRVNQGKVKIALPDPRDLEGVRRWFDSGGWWYCENLWFELRIEKFGPEPFAELHRQWLQENPEPEQQALTRGRPALIKSDHLWACAEVHTLLVLIDKHHHLPKRRELYESQLRQFLESLPREFKTGRAWASFQERDHDGARAKRSAAERRERSLANALDNMFTFLWLLDDERRGSSETNEEDREMRLLELEHLPRLRLLAEASSRAVWNEWRSFRGTSTMGGLYASEGASTNAFDDALKTVDAEIQGGLKRRARRMLCVLTGVSWETLTKIPLRKE